MAGTTVSATTTGMVGSDVLATRLEHNKLVDDVETLRAALADSVVLATELKVDYTALLADVTAMRTVLAAAVVDIAAGISDHNTLRTKLNADAGVTDTNYAAATAATSTAPAALTATAIAAATPSGTAVDAAADLLAAKVANVNGSTTT